MSHESTPTSPDPTPGSRTADYAYELPDAQIAHYPTKVRDQSRLLVMKRGTCERHHKEFSELPDLMGPGDVLVVNDSRVRPARFIGRKPTGAQAEILLIRPTQEPPDADVALAHDQADRQWWEALVKPGGKLGPGRIVEIGPDLQIRIVASTPSGGRIVCLESPRSVDVARTRHGRMPLPPYIDRSVAPEDSERYQTVYADEEGSVAAPTAGLHFTQELLGRIAARGVAIAHVTLEVGVGTFRPVDVDDPAQHSMHREWYNLSPQTVAAVEQAREGGGKVWAVGTTTVRVLETAAQYTGSLVAGSGWTDLFIRPGFDFKVVDRLITNFHLPRSTLLMLVSAFAGYAEVRAAYASAIDAGYRFYSYGDAMVLL